MLTAPAVRVAHRPPARRQSGVVLVVALIVLVAMTLAGLTLMRSMDTTNLIAGNLAFQQAATHSGDAGIEQAIAFLEANNSGTTLHCAATPQCLPGYSASSAGTPTTAAGWATFWTDNPGQITTLGEDAAGNTVSYVIHRLCNTNGDPTAVGVNCAVSQTSSTSTSSSKGAGFIALQYSSQVYYRITSRILGPRNTVSFVQAIVTM